MKVQISRRRRWLARSLILIGSLLVAAGIGYGGMIRYLEWREASSPSTDQVLIASDGTRISLAQPTSDAAHLTVPSASPVAPIGSTGVVTQTGVYSASPASARDAFYPPTSLVIPSIGVNRPAVLSTSNHMPEFKGIGWLLGSAYPGHNGNMVLFGHLDGPYATLDRLGELRPGDTFSVTTAVDTYTYQVSSAYSTPRGDVLALAPTDDPTATLITCSGHWSSALQDYTHRLIIKARLVEQHRS